MSHATGQTPQESILLRRSWCNRELLNGRISWRNDNWNLSIWGKNLTDNDYAVQTVVTQIFSGQGNFFLAPPGTYGATVRYDF